MRPELLEVKAATERRLKNYEKYSKPLTYEVFSELARKVEAANLRDVYYNDKNGHNKRDIRLGYCLAATGSVFNSIAEQSGADNIGSNLAGLAITLIDFASNFNFNLKEVHKVAETERKQFAHIKISPVPFTFYIFQKITAIKTNFWRAHQAGEALGKCFILAYHFRIDLVAEIEKQLETLKTK